MINIAINYLLIKSGVCAALRISNFLFIQSVESVSRDSFYEFTVKVDKVFDCKELYHVEFDEFDILLRVTDVIKFSCLDDDIKELYKMGLNSMTEQQINLCGGAL